MYSREPGSDVPFDGVSAVEGFFKVTPAGKATEVNLTMAYVNGNSQTTYGTCTVRLQMLSVDSLDALRKFLDSVEEDFGRVMFQHGGIRPQPPNRTGLGWRTVGAEKNEPMQVPPLRDDKSLGKKGGGGWRP